MGPKVVEFERSAEYVFARAMTRKRENHLIEAAELLRRAVLMAPENTEYQLELAKLYSEMQLYDLSNGVLLDVLCGENAPAECYYRLSLNQARAGREDESLRALEAYRRRAQAEKYETAEADVFDQLDQNLPTSGARKRLRAFRIAQLACEAVGNEDGETACRLFEKSFEYGEDMPDIRAIYTIALAQNGDKSTAVTLAKAIAEDKNSSIQSLCSVIQTLRLCEEHDAARECARRALGMYPDEIMVKALLIVLQPMEMHAEIAEMTRIALFDDPYDKDLLHARSVALYRTGTPIEEAAHGWRQIARMDPYDASAHYWLSTIEDGTFDDTELTYRREITKDTEAEISRRYVIAALRGKIPDLDEDPRMRWELEALLNSEEKGRQLIAMMIMANNTDRESVSRLRALLYSGRLSDELIQTAKESRSTSEDGGQKNLPPQEIWLGHAVPQLREELQLLPVYERQLIRFADDILHEHYHVSVGGELAIMWKLYTAKGGRRLSCTQEAAAALAWNYLLMIGKHPKPGELAERFDCKPRRMIYYARHMAALLEVDIND